MFMDQRLQMIPGTCYLKESQFLLPVSISGLPAFDWWFDPPEEVLLKAYLFNITNSEEFMNGTDSKLKVDEVGPIIYR